MSDHFVPRCYLAKFGFSKKNKENYVHTANINDLRIFPTNVKHICGVNGFNTLHKLPDYQKRFVEELYSDKIEGNYTNIYQKLVDSNSPSLTAEEKKTLIYFIASLYSRNYKIFDSFINVWNETIELGYQFYKEDPTKDRMLLGNNGYILFKDKTLEEVQKEQREESRETIVLTALKFIFKFAKLRLSSGISVWQFSSEHSGIYVCSLTSKNKAIITKKLIITR